MDVKKICVVGAGQMGQQIALNAAITGYDVKLYDSLEVALDKAGAWAEDYLKGRVEKGKMSAEDADRARKNFAIEKDLASAAKDTDMVIEAIVEKLDVKQEMFAKLDEICPKHTILASNSSSFVPSQLASVTKRPAKVVNMHFFNPALVMELVEVVNGPETSEDTTQTAIETSKKMKKVPILIKKEINGFVVNRILGRTLEEACRLLDAGIANIEDIDTAVTKGLRWPMGPFTIMDNSGVDISYLVRVQRFKETQNEMDRPPEILKKMYEEGKWGKKVGKGFYDYSK